MDFVGVADALAFAETAVDYALENGARPPPAAPPGATALQPKLPSGRRGVDNQG